MSEGFEVSGAVPESSRPWTPPDALILEVDGDGIPFRLGAKDHYHREPTSVRRLKIEAVLAPGAGNLALRWEWEGILAWIRNWREEAFEQPQEWTFAAPARGARLRWCIGKEPVDAHPPIPLTTAELVLRVP